MRKPVPLKNPICLDFSIKSLKLVSKLYNFYNDVYVVLVKAYKQYLVTNLADVVEIEEIVILRRRGTKGKLRELV